MSKDIMLIGSRAAAHWYSDFRKQDDWDYISENELDKSDCHYCPSFQLILDKYPNQTIAPPEVLYTLKVSHAFWDIHWEKTMEDIKFFQSKGLKVDEELYKSLYADCEMRYGKKNAYLNKPNEEFFTDVVDRVYVHDSIHEAIAYYDKPLYMSIKKDQALAMTSKELFLQLSNEDKIKLCKEEAYVVALERFMIPKNLIGMHPHVAYLKACKLLITSMTKGWFARHYVENWIDISKKDSYDYLRKFKEKVKNGLIKKINT